MAYRANPFLERMSERTTSDQEFVRLFSPKILERLEDDAFDGAVHIFTSPPGGGKTTLLRAFTPTALKAFWNARRSPEMSESHKSLVARGVLHEQEGPRLLGVLLSCASGYADLPPGASIAQEGLFRALLDCRIVLRALRSLATLLELDSLNDLESIQLVYKGSAKDLKHIPLTRSVSELINWAEQRERNVYTQLDSFAAAGGFDTAQDVRFEGVLWLQGVDFVKDGNSLPLNRLLMIDDLHKLRRKQRAMLIAELAELRPTIPVWLAERSIVLGDELLSQGVRQGRDVRHYPLEDIWTTGRGQFQFTAFAQNVLDRRLELQNDIPRGTFAQYLRSHFQSDESREQVAAGISRFRSVAARYQLNHRYSEWLKLASEHIRESTVQSLQDLYVTTILMARDETKRQLTLELGPLSSEELTERDNSQVQGAAEIFTHDELKIPYYFGIDRLCVMSTGNIEELLTLAAALYEGLQAKQVLRKPNLQLSPVEQEKLIKSVARQRREFIPKNHTEGTRAQRLLDAIGSFCREKTFVSNAPYAPGVTGVRLSHTELTKLTSNQTVLHTQLLSLKRVLAECVAENLLVARISSATTSRDSGTVFYLNRTLCAHYGLPLQMGGWQDVTAEDLIEWMDQGRLPNRQKRLAIG
jgi:hypothetical protein